LSCKGVDGGEVVGVEFSDEEERFSDGKVASVQYEPSDSPSLKFQKIKENNLSSVVLLKLPVAYFTRIYPDSKFSGQSQIAV
jgi:hypothetical protein